MQITIEPTAAAMARAAGEQAVATLRRKLATQPHVRMIVATGASQFDVLATVVAADGIDWHRVTVFHLDEYVGLSPDHPASFRRYLHERFADRLPLAAFHAINPDDDPHAECQRLGELIAAAPVDLALVGIGENGHLAFNDPPADFATHAAYHVVELDDACRQQQAGEGWFDSLADVPTQAISMTVAQILKTETIICSVPDERKAAAVAASVGPITPDVPATALQLHADCTLYLDEPAASQLPTPRPSSAFPLVDLQVNGYAGVDFNDSTITADDFDRTCKAIAADGVRFFLPTIITASPDDMRQRLRNLRTFARASELASQLVLGVHVEGPFLNPTDGYIGAHPSEHARAADADLMASLLEAAGGLVKLVTLAPEQVAGSTLVRDLQAAGITVAAGHTNATRDELAAAIDDGLGLFTHYGNACPAMLPRHDNILTRAATFRDRLVYSLIADGHHIPPAVLQDWLTLLPRTLFVSDAMAAASLGPGTYELGGQPVHVDDTLAAWSADRSHYAGAAMPLSQMVRQFADKRGETLACLQPLATLGIEPLSLFAD